MQATRAAAAIADMTFQRRVKDIAASLAAEPCVCRGSASDVGPCGAAVASVEVAVLGAGIESIVPLVVSPTPSLSSMVYRNFSVIPDTEG